MSTLVIVDERRVAKDAWGQAQVKVSFPPSSEKHAKAVQDAAQRCLDILEESVTGQKPMLEEIRDGDDRPLSETTPRPAPVAKGQTSIPGTGKRSSRKKA